MNYPYLQATTAAILFKVIDPLVSMLINKNQHIDSRKPKKGASIFD